MKKRMRSLGVALLMTGLLTACGTPTPESDSAPKADTDGDTVVSEMYSSVADAAVSFEHELDNYEPKKKLPIEDFLRAQGRFKHLFKPGNEHLIEQFQAEVDKRWEDLLYMTAK
jgi:pyruvate/2-oxoacid:ferredoxin oxidoreductase beta subunit